MAARRSERGPTRRDMAASILPRVTIHYAQTLDGRIATRTGQSQWISGAETLDLAHALRAEHDAVMVGIGTVLADNPRLTVRRTAGASPRRVIVDSRLRLPINARVLVDGAARTIVATTLRAPAERVAEIQARGAMVRVGPADAAGRVDLRALLLDLGKEQISSVLVEGGQGLITSLLRARLVRRIVICIAPKVIGAGIEAIGALGIDQLDHALTFSRATFRPVGAEMIFDGVFENEDEG